MPLTEAPIIVPSTEDISSVKFKYCEGCKFEYNYILANLSVIKESNYLEIKTGTEDQYEVKSDLLGEGPESKGKIHKIRLFKPSLNSYQHINNVEAELIIEHRSQKGNGSLSVCIPIISQKGVNINEDSKWLSKIIGMSPNKNGEVRGINGSFSLNKLIPRSEYIVLEKATGTWMDNKNSDNNNIIIMTTRGLTVQDTDIDKLNKITTSSPTRCSISSCWKFNENKTEESVMLDKSRITKSTRPIGEPGINHKPTMTCYPIDTDGKIIKKGYLSMEKTQVPLKDKPKESATPALITVIAILGGLLLLVLAVVLGPKIKHAIAVKLGLGKTAGAAAAAKVNAPLKG
tara:strand:- start:1485 stop:2519 length:1035 start_codon:yes stop_codon:yes gene_type:complete